MRYILNDSGYIEAVSFNNAMMCSNKTCTEYTGTVPTGYENLAEWSENANINAYKIVNGNLTYDSTEDARLQSLWESQLSNSSGETNTNNYSTEEQVIGTWFGKPLYRKVIQKTVAANDTPSFNLSDLGINNADVIFIDVGNSTAHYNTPVGGSYSSINFYSGTNDYGNVYVNYDRQLVIKNISGSNRDMYITLKYTKTTD